MNLENMRSWQLISMENNLKTLTSLLSILDHKDFTTYRDGGTGWTVLEVLCHLRDFETVFLERAKITVTEELGNLPFPNPDELAAEKHYNEENPQKVLEAWQANRAKLLAFYKERAESDWERPAMHPKRGKITLTDQLFLTPHHDTIHMEQLSRILAEKK